MIDIIIPTKGKVEYLFKCITSIINKTLKVQYHVYICDTGSSLDEIVEIQNFIKESFPNKNVTLLRYNYYNFAKINNHVVTNFCKSAYLLFCNNDIELIDNCIDRMYDTITSNDNTGTVGCRLLFSNNLVQHAGQLAFLDSDNQFRVTHRGLGSKDTYKPTEEVLGNTAALLLVKKDIFIDISGFNEEYQECFEDVELNISILCKGYTNIYLDDVTATHYESITRTRSRDASMRQLGDYNNILLPMFNSLCPADQEKVLNF